MDPYCFYFLHLRDEYSFERARCECASSIYTCSEGALPHHIDPENLSSTNMAPNKLLAKWLGQSIRITAQYPHTGELPAFAWGMFARSPYIYENANILFLFIFHGNKTSILLQYRTSAMFEHISSPHPLHPIILLSLNFYTYLLVQQACILPQHTLYHISSSPHHHIILQSNFPPSSWLPQPSPTPRENRRPRCRD
jgi:hypothetical protein